MNYIVTIIIDGYGYDFDHSILQQGKLRLRKVTCHVYAERTDVSNRVSGSGPHYLSHRPSNI